MNMKCHYIATTPMGILNTAKFIREIAQILKTEIHRFAMNRSYLF